MPLSVTTIILTFDEELHIECCIRSVKMISSRIVVIDSFSSDRTVEIAEGLGAEVKQRKFINQAEQFQWALDNCDIKTDWILRLDADENLEDSLQAEIMDRLPKLPLDVTGIDFKLKVIFKGHWIRFGGYYSTFLTRLWRTEAGRLEQRWMDERVVLSRGHSIIFENGDLVDENLKDIGWWTAKHNRYATRQMVDFINLEYDLFPMDQPIKKQSNKQSRWKRFLRNEVFARAPAYLRSILYFIYRYIFLLGFLDGKQGFVFHFLHGFWYFVLIDAKIEEARAYIGRYGVDAFREYLSGTQRIKL